MENNKIQVSTSSNIPVPITDVASLVEIRLNKARYPRYRDIPQATRQNWLAKEFLLLAKIVKARDVDKDYPLVFATTVDEQISASEWASDLTLPEIEYAFKRGVFGEYGEYYGFNAVSMFGFIEGYLHSEKKRDASKAVMERLDRERRDEEELRRKMLRAEMEKAKRDGAFVPTGKFDFRGATKSVDGEIDSSAHRAKIAQQARDILSGKL